VTGHFGLREPRETAPLVELAAVSAFIVPGLAFDRAGGRIGWGRGYYDVTLAAANPQALRIGIAFECQLVEQVPRDPHDIHLHYVVTEAAVYRAAD
jgi:5-formyltetrahydrofolate cyclo-ligase